MSTGMILDTIRDMTRIQKIRCLTSHGKGKQHSQALKDILLPAPLRLLHPLPPHSTPNRTHPAGTRTVSLGLHPGIQGSFNHTILEQGHLPGIQEVDTGPHIQVDNSLANPRLPIYTPYQKGMLR